MFGPFSTLLTLPSARVAARYGYAFVEGAGGAPDGVRRRAAQRVRRSIPVKNNLVTFAQWIASLPPAQRPKTAAYATVNDPFTQPQIPVAQQILQKAGVKTVSSRCSRRRSPTTRRSPTQIASTKADMAVLGSVDVPTVSAFVHAFIQQHYNPKAFIATAGPDQGAAFVKAVGTGNENGIFVPTAGTAASRRPTARRWSRSTSPSTAARPPTSTRTSPRLLGRPGAGPGGQGDRQPRQREDHQLPAQRRDPGQRPGSGEVRLARREHRPEDATFQWQNGKLVQ